MNFVSFLILVALHVGPPLIVRWFLYSRNELANLFDLQTWTWAAFLLLQINEGPLFLLCNAPKHLFALLYAWSSLLFAVYECVWHFHLNCQYVHAHVNSLVTFNVLSTFTKSPLEVDCTYRGFLTWNLGFLPESNPPTKNETRICYTCIPK